MARKKRKHVSSHRKKKPRPTKKKIAFQVSSEVGNVKTTVLCFPPVYADFSFSLFDDGNEEIEEKDRNLTKVPR